MTYLVREDDIALLPLSVRSTNCMRRAGIHTIGAMLDYPESAWSEIRNMGAKSVAEIQEWIDKLKHGTSEFALVDQKESLSVDTSDTAAQVSSLFLDESGIAHEDIAVSDLPITIRAKHSLLNAGINFASQLVGLTITELLSFKNMGRLTAEQVFETINRIHVSGASSTGVNLEGTDTGLLMKRISGELSEFCGQPEAVISREILLVNQQYPEAVSESLIYRLYESRLVRSEVKRTLIELVEKTDEGLSRRMLEASVPQHISNTTILDEILLEMEQSRVILIGDAMIYRRHLTISEYVRKLPEGRNKDILLCRLSGKTLAEVGALYNMTRERVRQIIVRELNKRPQLSEDKYLYIYDTYDFSREDFSLAFGEPNETYLYLEMVCPTARKDRKAVDEYLLADTNIPVTMRKAAEKAVYKNYISLNGIRFKKSRQNLVYHVIKQKCTNLTKYEDFLAMYQTQLEELGLGNDDSMVIESRTYENKLNAANYILWNQWRSFRYYNISENDYEELLSTIDLKQYENTELTTLKFFREYPKLMKQYDIRDEYELHNLLRKIWPEDDKNIDFRKMPTIQIGEADRDEQILSLLLQYAPISADDFASKYEEIYGAKAATVLGSYMGAFDIYFYNGMYSITSSELPAHQHQKMKESLTEDFYMTAEVKRIYAREFPTEPLTNINPYTLKTLGYRVYAGNSGYVVRNTHSSGKAYFNSLLTGSDIVDMREKNKRLCYIGTYLSELYELRSAYEIIEYAPLQYINIRRLNSGGVTKQQLMNYCSAVAVIFERGEYFTISSLRQDRFYHSLDDLGFDEWFYGSVLMEDTDSFTYQRIGGTRLFRRGTEAANLGDMLTWLLESAQKIDFHDLVDVLENRFNIHLPKEKLIDIIRGTELYYDTIMEAVYIDYSTYFEEI